MLGQGWGWGWGTEGVAREGWVGCGGGYSKQGATPVGWFHKKRRSCRKGLERHNELRTERVGGRVH
jgi:hypothetical protein